MFIPALTTVGASDSSGHSCVTTWPGVDPAFGTIDVFAAQADHLWTFPADGGTAPYAQRAMESPFTPQMKVGLGKFRVTGPHLYVWSRTDAWNVSNGLGCGCDRHLPSITELNVRVWVRSVSQSAAGIVMRTWRMWFGSKTGPDRST